MRDAVRGAAKYRSADTGPPAAREQVYSARADWSADQTARVGHPPEPTRLLYFVVPQTRDLPPLDPPPGVSTEFAKGSVFSTIGVKGLRPLWELEGKALDLSRHKDRKSVV